MKLSAWAKKHGYSYTGAWLKFKRGGLPGAYQLEDGTILVEEEHNKLNKVDCYAIYCRVSSSEQTKTNLEYQAKRLQELCRRKAWPIGYVVKETGSGLNDKRPKLLSLLKRDDITHLVVEHKDRLARFGVEYIKLLCELRGVKLIVVNKVEDGEEDLIQDFVSVITSFCARIYGKRRSKRKTELILKELDED